MTDPFNPPFTTRPDVRGHFGAAGSTHWLAAQTAMRMLELGGNAFDGAVAAGLVLQVAEPHLNGPLGEVPIMLHDAAKGRTRVICGQAPAPAAATIQKFEDLGISTIPGTGLLAAAIPGAFDAWMLLLRDCGSLPLDTIMEPAIGYALQGVPCVPRLAKAIRLMEGLFRSEWHSNAAVYLPGGALPEVGSFLKNPALGATWQRVLAEAQAAGPDRQAQIEAARTCWKAGFVAEAISEFCATQSFLDITGQRNGGLITAEDLAGWSAAYEEPVSAGLGEYQIQKCGPWSQGPAMLQAVQILKAKGLEQLRDGAGFYHLLTEAMKLAYADRECFYGDPDFVKVPLEQLLSDGYAAQRAELINETANNAWNPGQIPGFGCPVDYDAACRIKMDAATLAAAGIGEPTVAKDDLPAEGRNGVVRGDTCHINVADRWGNLVSATPSGGWMKSSPVIPELGVCLGTRLQMMRLDPKAPDALAPGKRPRTTLTPTIVTRADGSGYMACGTPGGDKQDQWQLAFLIRHLVLGQTPQQAIDAPGFHSLHWPNSFFPRQAHPGRLNIEDRVDPAIAEALRSKGHDLGFSGAWSEGYLSASYVNSDSSLGGASSARGMQGLAVAR
ncbi:gamma-glutamyltransferase [Leisingera sp. ANG-M1]|uniref:gamma-glutamyltransferase family protein n=1 Tax=Leisingera sp. ANG-M1 TaxID=1577895 RepID=UPI00057CEF2B|nr:gamma-glutamyltransferase [Leisingera sp. ANG-M1]KIC07344.1 gamma-glutamyltransferase [Leisingera sp. ANG-M1]